MFITHYKVPVTGQVQWRINHYHSRGRSVRERAFGIMKTRWRSTLFRALEVKPGHCFLCNVCLDNGDLLEPDGDISREMFDF